MKKKEISEKNVKKDDFCKVEEQRMLSPSYIDDISTGISFTILNDDDSTEQSLDYVQEIVEELETEDVDITTGQSSVSRNVEVVTTTSFIENNGIIRGHLNQSSNKFRSSTRGRQCTAMAAASIAFAAIEPPQQWTSTTIDNILHFGDKLCFDSLETRCLP